jgi:hypothetical protein
MAFRLYDAASAGAIVAGPITSTVPVTSGLFTKQLPWGFAFSGDDRWLDIAVKCSADSDYAALSPRQQITGAPYAFTLRPGANVVGNQPNWNAIYASNVATTSYSYGIRSQANAPWGRGVSGESYATGGMGVYGYSYSSGGAGVAGYIGGSNLDVYTFGSQQYGVYGKSQPSSGIGVYGTAPLTGVMGAATSSTGTTYGVYGESDSGSGIGGYFVDYGTGGSNWGLKGDGQSGAGGIYGVATGNGFYAIRGTNTNGVGGYFTNGNSSNYALYASNSSNTYPGLSVYGTSYFNGAKTGYVAEICATEDDLEPGDVVVIAGSKPPALGDIPVVVVRKAREAYATGVVGVVDARQVVNLSTEAIQPDANHVPEAKVHFAEGAIRSGDYLLVVTLGAYKTIKVDASYGSIKPGDLLVASPNPGYAMRAQPVMVQGVPVYPSGVIIGKALGTLEKGTGVIPVIVTLD